MTDIAIGLARGRVVPKCLIILRLHKFPMIVVGSSPRFWRVSPMTIYANGKYFGDFCITVSFLDIFFISW